MDINKFIKITTGTKDEKTPSIKNRTEYIPALHENKKDTVSFGNIKPRYSYEEKKNILNEKNITEEYAEIACNSLSDEEFDIYTELIDFGADEENAIMAARLSQEKLVIYKKLLNSGFDASSAMYALNDFRNTEQINIYSKLVKSGFSEYDALNYACSGDVSLIEKINMLKKTGISDSQSVHLATLMNDVQLKRYTELVKSKVSFDDAYKIAMLDEKKYNDYLNQCAQGIKPHYSGIIASFSPEKKKKFEELKSEGIQTEAACKILSSLNPKKSLELYKRGINFSVSDTILMCPETVYDRFSELCNYGQEYMEYLQIAISPYYDETIKHIKSGLSPINAYYCAKYEDTDEIDENAKELMKKGVFAYSAIRVSQDEDFLKNIDEKLKKGMPPEYVDDIVNITGYSVYDFRKADIETKACLNASLINLKSIMETEGLFDEYERENINELYKAISDDFSRIITPAKVSDQNIKEMMQGFFANNNPEIEEGLKSVDFSNFGKKGIPLKYSRENFISDLNDILTNKQFNYKKSKTEDFGINLIETEGKITGFDGILRLPEYSENDTVKQKIYDSVEKFLYKNEVISGDKKLDNILNPLIKGMPEFISLIGKQQHSTQDLSLDAHILKVLSESIKNPEYESLTNYEKSILKWSVILHDCAKEEGKITPGHAQKSALYAKDIMSKYNFSERFKDRVFNTINNHHWLEEYSTGSKNASDIAAIFRYPNDDKIARITAEADLKGVSTEFYEQKADSLSNTDLYQIKNILNKINSGGQLIFTSKLVKPAIIPETEYKGHKYKIVDFTKMNKDEDLSKYGFTPGTTKSSARFFAHMVSTPDALETVYMLSDVSRENLLCASFVSPEYCSTFMGRLFGVILDCDNPDIANASLENQGSGGHKDFNKFSGILTDRYNLSEFREIIPSFIKSSLNINSEEYAGLYKSIAKFNNIEQIKVDAIFEAGEKRITGKELKTAITDASDRLLSVEQNEVNLYNPKIKAFIAKTDSLEQIPEQYLNFVREHDLPVYLIGETNR